MRTLTCLTMTLLISIARADDASIPAGDYNLDKTHASLIFRVDHLGFSNYTARFTRFDANLAFDPAQMENATLNATVDATSIQTDFPNPEVVDFNAQLQNEHWLDTAKYPVMTFESTSIEMTGENTGIVHGDLTLHGVTKPVDLEVTFNGGYAGHPMDPNARIGFSANTSINRSDFGMDFGLPAPGTKMGVGDAVEIVIEAEFTGPPLEGTPDAPTS